MFIVPDNLARMIPSQRSHSKEVLFSTKHRILYLNPVSEIAGAEMSLLSLMSTLDREMFEPIVALPSPGPLVKRMAQLDVETITISQRQLKIKNPFPYFKTVFCLANLVRRRHVRLIHANAGISNQYGVMTARLCRIPIICHIRGFFGKRAFRRMFLNYADVLIANSHAVAASFSDFVSKSQKVVIIHNGVDLEGFSLNRTKAGMFRKKLGLPENAFVIGHLARVCPEKGQHILVDAIALVSDKHPEVYTLIVGDTSIDSSATFLASLKQQVQERGLLEKVIFLGFVHNIAELYADLDLVVLPSLKEPFGRTLIEGMAMMKPVIGTRAGGADEVVEDGVTGLLVPAGDSIQLAKAILNVMENRDAAREFGANGRKRVEKFFSIDQNVRKTEQIYLEVLRS